MVYNEIWGRMSHIHAAIKLKHFQCRSRVNQKIPQKVIKRPTGLKCGENGASEFLRFKCIPFQFYILWIMNSCLCISLGTTVIVDASFPFIWQMIKQYVFLQYIRLQHTILWCFHLLYIWPLIMIFIPWQFQAVWWHFCDILPLVSSWDHPRR